MAKGEYKMKTCMVCKKTLNETDYTEFDPPTDCSDFCFYKKFECENCGANINVYYGIDPQMLTKEDIDF